jgi:hypothetical protein
MAGNGWLRFSQLGASKFEVVENPDVRVMADTATITRSQNVNRRYRAKSSSSRNESLI